MLFDGECLFCQACVRFILDQERQPLIHFAPLQSEVGKALRRQYRVSDTIDSMLLIESGQAYVKSTAALRVCRYLRQPWRLLAGLRLIPAVLRDWFYDAFGQRRYQWFGRDDQCMVPDAALKRRFLTDTIESTESLNGNQKANIGDAHQ